jgi:hypothetical protein
METEVNQAEIVKAIYDYQYKMVEQAHESFGVILDSCNVWNSEELIKNQQELFKESIWNVAKTTMTREDFDKLFDYCLK